MRSVWNYILYLIKSINGKKRFNVVNFSSNASTYYTNYYFSRLFRPGFFQYSTYKPDIVFFETHGDRSEIEKSNSKIKILFTGENVHSIVSPTAKAYDDYCLQTVDLALGFDYMQEPNYIRFPLWLQYFFEPVLDMDSIQKKVTEFNTRSFTKNKFCSLVSTHDKTGIREKILGEITRIGEVDCPGRFWHNDDTLRLLFNDDKESYLNQYKFNLCPENDAFHGYVTEKIFQAFWSDCIPIYWGADPFS